MKLMFMNKTIENNIKIMYITNFIKEIYLLHKNEIKNH